MRMQRMQCAQRPAAQHPAFQLTLGGVEGAWAATRSSICLLPQRSRLLLPRTSGAAGVNHRCWCSAVEGPVSKLECSADILRLVYAVQGELWVKLQKASPTLDVGMVIESHLVDAAMSAYLWFC